MEIVDGLIADIPIHDQALASTHTYKYSTCDHDRLSQELGEMSNSDSESSGPPALADAVATDSDSDSSGPPPLVDYAGTSTETETNSDTLSDTDSDSDTFQLKPQKPKGKPEPKSASQPAAKSKLTSASAATPTAKRDNKSKASDGDAEIVASAPPAVDEPARSSAKKLPSRSEKPTKLVKPRPTAPPAPPPPPPRKLDLSCWDDVVHVKWNIVETIDWPILEDRFITLAEAIAASDRGGRDDDYKYDGDSSTSDEEDFDTKTASGNVTGTPSASTTATAPTSSARIHATEWSEHARNWFARASQKDRLRFQRKIDFIAEFVPRAKAGHASETNIGRTKKMKGCKKVNLWRTKLDKGWGQSQTEFICKTI